jgi:endonuclease/exonuclease/phosphatase family metal-dependent hydrolase
MKRIYFLLLMLMPMLAQAQLLLSEGFNYAQNSRLSASGWTAHSGVGTNSPTVNVLSLDYYNANSSGGFAASMASSGEDVNKSFGNINSGSVYVAFKVNIKTAQDIGDYFLHLGPSVIDTVFRARVFVKKDGEKFQFGIAKTRNATYTTEGFNFDQVYSLVIKYTFKTASAADDEVELFVNATTTTEPANSTIKGTSTENDTRDNIGSIALRQGTAANAATLVIDDIRAGRDWASVVANYDLTKMFVVRNNGTGSSTDLNGIQNFVGNTGVIIGEKDVAVVATTTAATVMTAPTNFEISTSNTTTYATTATVPVGQSLNFKIRPKAGLATGVYTGVVTVVSTGFPTLYLAVKATILDPGQKDLNIAQARGLPLNSVVQVSGTVTAQFGSTLYIQDATAGVPIYLGLIFANYAIGDSITVNGPMQTFNSQIQIGGGSAAIISIKNNGKSKTAIIPKTIKMNELAANEGRLVKIDGATFTNTKGLLYADVNWAITTADGSTEARISRFTDLGIYNKPQAATNITGVVSRFRNTAGTTDIYQIFPRSKNDFSALGAAYSVAGNETARTKTLDIATWNVTWFGSTSNGPTDETLQLNNVKKVLDSLQADIYILSEVSNSVGFASLMSRMTGFSGQCSPRLSQGGSDLNGQRVCFVYKTDVFKNPTFKNLLVGTNTANLANYPVDGARFWASGRLPYLMTADVVIDNVTQKLNFVGIHARANTSGADAQTVYDQRKYDIKVLKDTLDAQYANVPLIMAGDYNDDVDETVAAITTTKESTYKSIIDDATKYRAVTKSLSDKGLRSFLTSENVIDHVITTNEFFDNLIVGSEGHELPFRYITDYGTTTSDHLPIFARFKLTQPITGLTKPLELSFLPFPNPTTGSVQVRTPAATIVKGFRWYDLSGQSSEVFSRELAKDLYEITPINALPTGAYILGIETTEKVHYRKVLVK